MMLLAFRRRFVDAGHAQQLGRIGDRRQRVAQLVRQHGQEFVLHLAVALGLGARGAFAGQDAFALPGRALRQVIQARVVDRHRGLGHEAGDELLGALVEHLRLRVPEEQATQHLARARADGRGEIAAHRQVPFRHAVVRPHAAVARVLGDVVAADRRAAIEGGAEDRGRARVAEVRKGFARRAAERVQQVGVAVGVLAVVEEGAEFGAGQLGGGVGDGLQQGVDVERGGQHLASAIQELEHARLFAQRFLGADAAQRFPGAARQVFGQGALINGPAVGVVFIEEAGAVQPVAVLQRDDHHRMDAEHEAGLGDGRAFRVGRDVVDADGRTGAQRVDLVRRQHVDRQRALGAAGFDAVLPLFLDGEGALLFVEFDVGDVGVGEVFAGEADGRLEHRPELGFAAQGVGQLDLVIAAAFAQHRLGDVGEGDQHALDLAAVAVDRAVRIAEVAGLVVAVAVDRQRQAFGTERLALAHLLPHRADGWPDLGPGDARIVSESGVLFVAEDGDIGVVEELDVGVAPGEIRRQAQVEYGTDSAFQALGPAADRANGGGLPGEGAHAALHFRHRRRCACSVGSRVKGPRHGARWAGM